MSSPTDDTLLGTGSQQEIPRFLSRPELHEVPVVSSMPPPIQPETPTDDIKLDSTTDLPGSRQFEGDTGTLKGETRRCLVALLSGPSVDGRRQPVLWQVLVRDRRELQSRLHDIFLDLVVDTEQQVAFIRQIASDDGDSIPILLRRQQLTFIESALVLFLRQRLTEADSANERAVVSAQEMTDHLSVFEKANNTDGVKFDKQCVAAIEKCKQLNLIRPIRASDGRFEVSPTLKLLFSAEDIQTLTDAYETLKVVAPDDDLAALEVAIAKGIAEGEAPDFEELQGGD
ncbi:DUF4194 domain-containing protein [Ralstonia pseudosolanacearum]|uniref:DUF4194 domain-containing protein n=1 Tax=Ralstonia pseudosolanacearum TaxID=1310165 RepID=UPI001FF72B24|nr:DUF4194 domain-containing protein [Ralstonia pseudosolanacearum]